MRMSPKVIAFFVGCGFPGLATADGCPEDGVAWSANLSVSHEDMAIQQDGSSRILTSFGTLRNDGPVAIEDLVLDAQFFDADGKLIDALSESLYGLVVPANGESSFRLQGYPAQEGSKYSSQKVRITDASVVTKCPPRSNERQTNWTRWATSWSPVLLLILVWVFFFWRSRKAGPLVETVQLQKQQLEISERLAKEAARIADALERRDRRDGDAT